MSRKTYQIDMCHGPLLPKLLKFSFPLMLSGVLQLLFNAADVVVVGQYSSKEALAAVGSTTSLINLLINVFVGLSIGTNVLVARYMGAKSEKDVSETVHTSIFMGFLCGTVLIFVGLFLAKPMLILMGSPDDVIDMAVTYVRIYFLSMPAVMLYNFGSAILRAVGDTQRPLVYLTVAGVINVICNLFLVIVMDWGVAGVAVATSLSQIVSAVLVMRCLLRTNDMYRFRWRLMRIHSRKLKSMMRVGLPAGIQGSIFSISNVLIQSSVNSFGSIAMAGSAAASSIEGFIWQAMNSIYQANLSFTSQNLGARKYSRINRITWECLGIVTVIGLVAGVSATIYGEPLLSIYNSDPDVIAFGLHRMYFISLPYFICGLMDVICGSMRGLGFSIVPTIVSLTGACGLRVFWVLTIFANDPRPEVLFFSYPLSWVVTGLCHGICFIIARRNFPKNDAPEVSEGA